jgi:5-methylcytosine-specific restriction endonuclease McrA
MKAGRVALGVGAVVLWLVLVVLWVVWTVLVYVLVRRRRTRRRLTPDFPRLFRIRTGRPEPAYGGRQRVQRTARERDALVELLRRRDGDDCQLCGGPLDFYVPQSDPYAEEVDHVVPFSRGGDDHVTNYALAHRVCNQSKGARWSIA